MAKLRIRKKKKGRITRKIEDFIRNSREFRGFPDTYDYLDEKKKRTKKRK